MNRNYKTIFRLVSALALTLSATLSARADYASTVLSQNPVGYYPLNETVQPSQSVATNSGSLGASANGTYVSLPSLNQPGPFAGSVSVGLDGSASYVSTPWQTGLNTTNFSFEIWAKPAIIPNFAYLASSVEVSSPRSGWYFAQDNGSTFGHGSAWVVRFFNQNTTTPSVTLVATNVNPGWVDLTLTYDGTTAKLYTNAVLADVETPTGYVPNVDAPFTVGCRSSLNFNWPGNVAEMALYGKALTSGEVYTHYNAGITLPSSYAAEVLIDAPLVYDRYQAPVQPVAANLGTLGSAGDGLYLSDAVAGTPGPTPPPYPGFTAANKAPAFDAGGGAVRLPPFNFNTNTVTISGWVNATNVPLIEEPGAGIVVCDGGTTGGGLIIDGVNGGLGLGYYWNNDPNTYNLNLTSLGLPTLNNEEWDYVALVIQPTEADIYISSPTIPFTSVTNVYPHVNQAFDAATLIGTDAGDPTFSFNGAIDEVAIWNRSLASGELYSQYASAVGGLGPIVFSGPPSPDQPIVAGDTLTLAVNAGGTPNLFYQWFSNSVAISGATSSVYTKPNFSIAGDSGNYFVIVTNTFGSATSGVAVVTGQLATAPVITSQPASSYYIYPNGTLALSVGATGGGLQFQWSTNGVPIPGATKSSYVVSSVSTNDAGSYTVSVTNILGATNLGPFVVTVPYLAPGTYAQVVAADAPEAWWRLDDVSAVTGAPLADVMGRHPGSYTNAGGLTVGNPGAITGGLAGTAATFTGDASYGSVPYFSGLSDQKFTLELWAKQASVVNGVTAVSSGDSSGNNYGIGAESYWQGIAGGKTFGSAPGATAGFDPTIVPGQWIHLVITHDPEVISGTTYAYEIYVNGVTDGFIWEDSPLNSTDPFIIGGLGTGLSSVLSQNFIGSVDEVAFYANKVLSSTEIQAHYAAAFYGVPPSFSTQPLSQNAIAGDNITFSVSVVGAPPISVQWKKNGVNLPSQTNDTLTVSNVYYTSDSDVYSAVATNAFGYAISSNAMVTVYYPPTYANLTNGLVLHLTFDGNYLDTSGHNNNGSPVGAPTFVPGKIGSQAVSILTDTTNSTYNYVTLGNPADFQFGSSVDFSVSYWVQFPVGALPGDLPFLCSADNSTGGFGLTLAPAYKTGGWAWSLDNSSAVGAGVQGPAGSINDGAWHNVVETFSRTGNCTTFLDGAQVNATPIEGIGNVDSGGPFNVGQDPTGMYGESGTYALDDMGLWRRALTDIEARSIYIAGQNYGKSFDTFGPASLAIYKYANGNVGVAWQSGTLLSSGKVNGPWTPVPGATAPVYQITPSLTNTFYGVGP